MIEDVLRKSNPWWSGSYASPGVARDRYLMGIEKALARERIVLLFGLRRVGKTTIMRQYVASCIKRMEPSRILFAGIDHPELERTPLYEILKEFRSLNGLRSSDEVILFLDEVQSRPGFEKELKAIHDLEEKVRVVASGSSSLIIKHRSSNLVGRYRTLEVRPLDFAEYLKFRREASDRSEPHLMERFMDDYLTTGGMPQYVQTLDQAYVTDLVANVISRDICTTYSVSDPRLLRELYFLLMNRVGKRLSYSKLARLIDTGDDAVKRYVGYFEDAFLIHIEEQEGSPNERKYGPKKCYASDNGICSVISGKADKGPLAENAVYLGLRKRSEPRFYNRMSFEVDFLCGNGAFEVKYRGDVAEKDIERFRSFRHRGVKNKWLITRSEEDRKGEICKIPLWKFILNDAEDEELTT